MNLDKSAFTAHCVPLRHQAVKAAPSRQNRTAFKYSSGKHLQTIPLQRSIIEWSHTFGEADSILSIDHPHHHAGIAKTNNDNIACRLPRTRLSLFDN